GQRAAEALGRGLDRALGGVPPELEGEHVSGLLGVDGLDRATVVPVQDTTFKVLASAAGAVVILVAHRAAEVSVLGSRLTAARADHAGDVAPDRAVLAVQDTALARLDRAVLQLGEAPDREPERAALPAVLGPRLEQ